MRKPPPLRAGQAIGVVAPAGATDVAALDAGVRVLEQAGFRVRLGASVRQRSGYLAGSDSERLRDLEAMFRDPEVGAILASRGGYGSGRLLPLLDIEVVKRQPKALVGFSDLTFLLTHVLQAAELVTFHGPMVVGIGRHPEEAAPLLGMLTGDRAGWNLSAKHIIEPGTAEGMVVGGCLSVIVAMLGTPYELQTAGRLLFLEDVNEKPYRVDRMLTQLRQAGKLDSVAGVIFGEMPGCSAEPNEAVTVRDVIREAFASDRYPVAMGLPTGHGEGHATLPIGVRARLAGERLTLLESPLAE